MQIKHWYCKTCSGSKTPCMATLVGGSVTAATPTKCTQDVDQNPDWVETTLEQMEEEIRSLLAS